jgi:hypothetical protein
MTDTAATIVTLGIGAVLGYCANYSIEKFKRQSAMTDARRKAYASWFTSEALLVRRIDIVCGRLVGFPRDPAKHEELMVEISSLVDDGRTLVTAMNEAFLTEKSWRVRRRVSVLHNFLIKLVQRLEAAAQHYKENLAFHEHIDMMTVEQKEQFLIHDSECYIKSSTFRTELGDDIALGHKEVERLRNSLAGTLSR